MATTANRKHTLRVGHRVMIPATVKAFRGNHDTVGNVDLTLPNGKVIEGVDSSAIELHPGEPDYNNTPPGLPNVIKDALKGEERDRQAKAADTEATPPPGGWPKVESPAVKKLADDEQAELNREKAEKPLHDDKLTGGDYTPQP